MNSRRPALLALPAALMAALASCTGSGGHNGSPVIATIPVQTGASGAQLTVDLAAYVADPEHTDAELTFEVLAVEGADPRARALAAYGGAFLAGADNTKYRHTFDTLGTYTVHFRVTDPEGHRRDGSFQVRVNTGTLHLYQVEGDLRFVDAATAWTQDIAGAGGQAEAWAATLANGTIVFRRTVGSQDDLYAYVPATGALHTVAGDPAVHEAYVAATSWGAILYSKGAAGQRDLFLYDPASRATTTVSAHPQDDLGAAVGAGDDIFFERAAAGGQRDIYHFDPDDGQLKAVSTHERDEGVSRVLPNGNLVWWRLNENGRRNLLYYDVSGAAYTVSAADEDAVAVGNTAESDILYTRQAATKGLYLYDVSAQAGTAVAAGGANDITFVAVMGAGDRILFLDGADLKHYRVSTAATSGALGAWTWLGKLADDDTFVYGAGTALHTYKLSTAADLLLSANASFNAVLSNDDVVFEEAGALKYRDASAAATVTVGAGDGNETYRADLGGGKFVLTTTGGSGNIYLRDAAAGTTATVTNAAAVETYLGFSAAATTILYSRGATRDLYLYNWTTAATTRVTDTDSWDEAFVATVNVQ